MTRSLINNTAFIALGILSASLWAAAPTPAQTRAQSFQIADNHTAEPMGEPMAEPVNEPMGESTNGPMNDGPMNDAPMNEDSMNEPMASPSASTGTIVDVASSNEAFNTLVQAVTAADLAETLSAQGPYTVFAPTDEAFAQLPEGALEFLLQPENEELLKQVLTYHVVPGEITSDELSPGGISALGGGLAIGTYNNRIVINNASVITPDIQASNGVVHVINRVLVPSALQEQLSAQLGVSSLFQ